MSWKYLIATWRKLFDTILSQLSICVLCCCISMFLSVNAIMSVKLYFKTNLKFHRGRGGCFKLAFLQSFRYFPVEGLHPERQCVMIVVTWVRRGKIGLRQPSIGCEVAHGTRNSNSWTRDSRGKVVVMIIVWMSVVCLGWVAGSHSYETATHDRGGDTCNIACFSWLTSKNFQALPGSGEVGSGSCERLQL